MLGCKQLLQQPEIKKIYTMQYNTINSLKETIQTCSIERE